MIEPRGFPAGDARITTAGVQPPRFGKVGSSFLAAIYGLRGETDKAAANLAEARRLFPDGRYSSIARRKATGLYQIPGYWGVPKVAALFEATYFAGLRKAGMPEE